MRLLAAVAARPSISMAAAGTTALNAFLARSHARLEALNDAAPVGGEVHIVLGNEAADPDSCVCAIAMAAALDAAQKWEKK